MNNWRNDNYSEAYLLANPTLSFRDPNYYFERILELLHGFNPKSIIDVCCGTGDITLAAERHGYKISGLDKSSYLLNIARKKSPHLTWYEQDVLNLDIKDRFELVLCLYNSFGYYQTDKENLHFLKNIRKLLSDHGVLVLEFPSYVYISEIFEEKDCYKTWVSTPKGYILEEAWWHEETSIIESHRIVFDNDNRKYHFELNTKLYTLNQMKEFLHDTGFSNFKFVESPEINTEGDKSSNVLAIASV